MHRLCQYRRRHPRCGAVLSERLVNALVGAPIVRKEDSRLLKGRGRYIDDVVLDGMLHAAIVRSSRPHGRILGVDTRQAAALPGVAAVFTQADLADVLKPIPSRIGALPGFDQFLQLPLAVGKVRYVGEPIAVVVAESAYIAEDALSLVSVEIEELPAVVDWATAVEPVALIHERAGTNVSSISVGRGRPDEAFATAPYVRRERFRVQRHTALPMETRGLVAVWDATRVRMDVLGATKIPFFNRRILATMLDLPETSVDLKVLDVGGGFGVRGEFYPEDFLIPFAARALNRPVKWIEDRREHLMATNHSRDVACDLEIACDRDGRVLALRAEVFVDIGAYARGTGGTVPTRCAQFLPGPYRIPHFACNVNAHLSNKTPAGTYRGPGRVEANFFRERLLDMAAADLGIDPAEFRRRNLVSAADMPYDIGQLVTYEGPVAYDSGDFHAVFDRALKEIGWHDKQPIQGRNIDGWYHGIGLACFVESGAGGLKENARMRLHTDGTLDVYVGSASSGQGHETVLAQVCADALGIPMDQVRIICASTDELDEGFGTWHSRTAVMAGNAVLKASHALLERLRLLASDYFGRPNVEVTWDRGRFHLADAGRDVTLETLAAFAAARNERIDVAATFEYSGRKPFSYGTNAAHVAVDPRTGRVKVVDFAGVEDIGRAINPLITHGQAMGAIVQGLGGAFLEHLVYDETGQLLTGSLADYMLPTASDFPNVRGILVEIAPAEGNPLGAKGAGEGGIVAVAAAVANAVTAALSSLGVQARELPLSPPRVWKLVALARAQSEQRANPT
ncbi:MAG: xanthine dehydrogenase family protein molybdopterin-binding subunit [Hyphomicrobiales bacterium]|nr:xanthine dehydrogenase family protein molybdopterin-binding subunit [Hyphomicrobiales bacterium]